MTELRTDQELHDALFEAAASGGGGLGSANWIVLSIAQHKSKFSDPNAFIDLWLDGIDLPDEQLAWIMSNAFDHWADALISPQNGTAPSTDRLRLLKLAGERESTEPVLVGTSGGSQPRRPTLIDLLLVDAPADKRRIQVLQEPNAPDIMLFEFSNRAELFAVPLAGETTIDNELIPEAGLDTRWRVSSKKVLEPVDAKVTVSAAFNTHGERVLWFCEFDLTIPKHENSDYRRVQCVEGGEYDLDIRIYVNDERSTLLRHLTALVDTTRGGSIDSGNADEDVVTDLADAIDPPHFEYTTPPNYLHLTVYGNDDIVTVTPSYSSGGSVFSQPWASAPEFQNKVTTLRKSAEIFRSAHSDALDDINAAEMSERLEAHLANYYLSRTMDWSFDFNDEVKISNENQTAWDEIANSDQAHELAYHGYQLFNTCFPEGSKARMLIDQFPAGSRINIDWPLDVGNASMPWNLMYTNEPDDSLPIDGNLFFGLRFRSAWTKWRKAPHGQQLGRHDEAERLHLLYWNEKQGDKPDKIWIEANAQRKAFEALGKQQLLPSLASETPRADIIAALTSPTNASIIHFYCHCTEDKATEQAKLLFGPPTLGEESVRLMGRDFGRKDLRGMPFVFINACNSATGDAYELNRLEQMFFDRGSRAFMGTEVRVPIVLAARYAQVFFHLLENTIDDQHLVAGEAAALARRYLWMNYRNIGGLFYSYIHHYELRLS